MVFLEQLFIAKCKRSFTFRCQSFTMVVENEEREIVMLENRVRELRARFRWTQQDLADAVGVTRQTIGLIEKGDYSPSVTMALKIAAAFQVTVEDVFYLNGEE